MTRVSPAGVITNETKRATRDMTLVPCCCGQNEEQRNNDRINSWLASEEKIYRVTHRLLLLGAGESGKSTIVKQMQIINMKGFNHKERETYVPLIFSNIREAMGSMLGAMNTLVPPIVFTSDLYCQASSRILETYTQSDAIQYTDQFFEDCKVLWRTPEVQECYSRSNEYHLIDSAKYFLDRIQTIRDEFYLPDDQDILRCRVMTTQILEIRFKIKDAVFHMFDVGGQRDQRRKWIQCFNDATAVVFVVSLSGYNLFLREDETKNRMQESMDLFRKIWKNRFLKSVSVILFLNKQDILLEKIVSNKFKIEDYFPRYQFYPFPVSEKQTLNEPAEFIRAKFFFRDIFISLTQKQADDEEDKPKAFSPRGCEMLSRTCYPHFTCAVNTNHMRKIFDDCRTMIQRIHLERFGILTLDG